MHHFKPETMRQLKEWHQANSLQKKRIKAAPSMSKVIAIISWDIEGVIPVDIMTKGTTTNSEAYVQTLQKCHVFL
jgi:hypothetical protein